MCERFVESPNPGGNWIQQMKHVYDAINCAARSHNRFDLQLDRGTQLDILSGRVFYLVKMTNTIEDGCVWIDKDGYYKLCK